MTRVSDLWRLQLLDQETDEKIRRTHQIEAALAGDPKLTAARNALDGEAKRQAELRATLQDPELEAKTLDAKIKELEARLSSGRVTNPKELDSLEKDRQMHLRNRGDLDGKMLELMDGIERAQKSFENSNALLKKAESARTADTQRLGQEQKSIAARLEELGSLRNQARAAIDAQSYAMYDRLRSAKSGSAVARVKSSACSACGMQIPSALVSRVDDGEELVFCPDCGRILIG